MRSPRLHIATVAALTLLASAAVGCGTDDNRTKTREPEASPVVARDRLSQLPANSHDARAGKPGRDTTSAASAEPSPASRARPPGPPAPRITAQRVGRRVSIRYQLPPASDPERRPWLLVASVDSASDRFPPLTIRHELRGRLRGTVRQPLGAGQPPYRVLAEVLARSGIRSRIVTVPVR